MRGLKLARRHGVAACGALVDAAVAPFVDAPHNIVLTGFWRSGTSWLLQVVCDVARAKSVFEPLYPELPQLARADGPLRRTAEASGQTHAFMPWAQQDFAAYPDLERWLRRSLAARIPGWWVRRARRGLHEAARRRVVVKLVRGQLCVGAMLSAFPCTVVHVHRDPRAVVASILRGGWGDGWLDRLRLGALLLDPDDGRRAVFERWRSDIERLDRERPLARVAAYWALTEWSVREVAAEDADRLHVLRYEDLVGAGARVLADVLGLDAPEPGKAPTERPSPTTSPSRSAVDSKQRTGGWRSELSADDRNLIESTVAGFGLGDRLGAQ